MKAPAAIMAALIIFAAVPESVRAEPVEGQATEITVAEATTAEATPAKATATEATAGEKSELRFDARRGRLSFQARFSGGIDFMRAAEGVGGLIQVGIGTGRWFDIHTGVGFPSYSWVTDFELNLYPFGRFVPILGLRVALGFLPNHEAYAVEAYAGCEFWILDWLGAYVRVGIGHTWNPSWNMDYLVVPAWAGIEMRY